MTSHDATSHVAPPAGPSPGDNTAVLPRSTGWSASSLALLSVAVAAGSFLVGIALATATRPAPEVEVLAEQEVGRGGATVSFDGGRLVIPRGALPSRERIYVRRSRGNEAVRVELSGGPLDVRPDVAYEFGPHEVRFTRPARLTFRLPDRARNAAVFVRTEGSVILLPAEIDPDAGTATVEISDLGFDR